MWESQAIEGGGVGNSAMQHGQLPFGLRVLASRSLHPALQIHTDRSLPLPIVFLASAFPSLHSQFSFFRTTGVWQHWYRAIWAECDFWAGIFGDCNLQLISTPPPEPWADQLLRTDVLISSITFEVMLSPFIFQFHYSIAERYLHML